MFGDITAEEKKSLGKPREKYPTWIAQLKIDDYAAGYSQAKALIANVNQKAKTSNTSYKNIIALAGAHKTVFNEERIRGLKDALNENDKFRISHTLSASWRQDLANKAVERVLKRYQKNKTNIDAIWSANTDMAIGAAEAIKQTPLKLNQDIFVSGIDFSKSGIELVKKQELSSIVGGHNAAVAWLLVMIYDFHHGIDFVNEDLKIKPVLLTQRKAIQYTEKLSNMHWGDIDFRNFSKVYNKELKTYNFDFESIFEQLSNIQGQQ